jgi:hypothetical protein
MASTTPSSAAERMRQYRKRRREGHRHVTIELDKATVDCLVSRKLLEEQDRDDPVTLQAVVLGLVYDAADGLLVRRRQVTLPAPK